MDEFIKRKWKSKLLNTGSTNEEQGEVGGGAGGGKDNHIFYFQNGQ